MPFCPYFSYNSYSFYSHTLSIIGLGTSTSAEAKEYFSNLQTHEIDFEWDERANDMIDMAFAKKRVDDRKVLYCRSSGCTIIISAVLTKLLMMTTFFYCETQFISMLLHITTLTTHRFGSWAWNRECTWTTLLTVSPTTTSSTAN